MFFVVVVVVKCIRWLSKTMKYQLFGWDSILKSGIRIPKNPFSFVAPKFVCFAYSPL